MNFLYNPMRRMNGKFLLLDAFFFYYLVTSFLKEYFTLKTHYPFPTTLHFKQASCHSNYPA